MSLLDILFLNVFGLVTSHKNDALTACITPIFKSSDKSTVSNYCSISLYI